MMEMSSLAMTSCLDPEQAPLHVHARLRVSAWRLRGAASPDSGDRNSIPFRHFLGENLRGSQI